MELITSYLSVMLFSISLTNPIPPLAQADAWIDCVQTCYDCGDMEYEDCDYQYDPYQIVIFPSIEENDGR